MFLSTSRTIRKSRLSRAMVILLCHLTLSTWVCPPSVQAGLPLLDLPQPGTMVKLSAHNEPALIRGMRVFADNPLRFDFIIDVGQNGLEGDELTQETRRLIKYFLASLTVPEDEMWVNLSPYENDRIVPASFGITEMGRDLLAQDYILKQITATLMYPEDKVGQEFWDRVYAKAQQKFGTTDIPVNTFNKVWIVPEKAVVYENGDTAYVVRSHLKVMLEEDYLASEASRKADAAFPLKTDKMANGDSQSPEVTEIIREVMIPEIEREVNEGEHFRPLRQIYNSMILATWFKRNLRQSFLGRKYVDQKKLSGVDVDDKDIKNKIYQQYLEAFREGAYSYIKEEFDPVSQEIIPRRYFSGGTSLALSDQTFSVVRTLSANDRAVLARTEDRLRIAPTSLQARSPRDAAILSERSYAELLLERFIGEGASEAVQREEIAEYLRNYSFVARHSRATVEDTSPTVVKLFDDFAITDKTQQSNILSVAQVLIDLQANPVAERRRALDRIRELLNQPADTVDNSELFELLALLYRLGENRLLVANAGEDFLIADGLLRGQARSIVRTDPRYSGVTENGNRVTNMPVALDQLAANFSRDLMDGVLINRQLGIANPAAEEVTPEEIGIGVAQSGAVLNDLGQLIMVVSPQQAEAVAEAIREGPFTGLFILAGSEGVLVSAEKRGVADSAVLSRGNVELLYDAVAAEAPVDLGGRDEQQVRREMIEAVLNPDLADALARRAAVENVLTPQNVPVNEAVRRFADQFLQGLDELQSLEQQAPTERTGAEETGGRRMPQNPRVFSVTGEQRDQLVQRYGEEMIAGLEAAGQLENIFSLSENLKSVVAELDALYTAAPRKPDQPRLFIRGGIIRRFEAQDLADLLPNTDIDVIVADADNYTVRDRQNDWFDNNRVQVMALPVSSGEELVEIDREQISQSPSYLLDLWAGFAGITPGNPPGTRDQARLAPTTETAEPVGGIDLNPTMLQIESQGQGIELETPVDMKELESMPIEGFTPVIFQIVPVNNLPLLLGINDLEAPPDEPQESVQLSAARRGALRPDR